jgi:hypothetical protein
VANLVSAGGVYLVGNLDEVQAWPGSEDQAVYDSIPFGADEGLVTAVSGIPFIVLGIPDPLHVVRTGDGVTFATAIFCNDESAIEGLVAGASDEDWSPIGEVTVTGAVVVFDSALSGADAAVHGITIDHLSPGTYRVESRLFTPDPDTELQLVRLLNR